MSTPAVDYQALAKQHGAIAAQPTGSDVDYSAIAAKSGGIHGGDAPAAADGADPDEIQYKPEPAEGDGKWHPFWEIPALRNIEPMMAKMAQGMGASTGEVVSSVAKGINKIMPNSVQIPHEGIAAMDANNAHYLQEPEQKAGAFIEDAAQFLLGDEALKGLSYAEKLKRIAPVLKNLEAHPRLAKAVEAGMRQGTVSGAQTAAHGGDAGDVAGAALFGGTIGGLAEGGGQVARKFWKPTAMTEAQAATRITQAINPSKEAMTDFTANVTKHVSTIEDFATRNNIPLDSVDNFTQAAQGAAKEHSQFFYEKLLNPIKAEMIGTAEIPNFGGETLGEGRNVTDLGKLDARLTAVNKMLSPAYAGNGMTSEARQALDAEAAGIRKTLYEAMGKKLGIEPQAVAQVRAGIGELNSIGEQSELSANAAKHTANAEAKKPISFNPWHKETEKFVADKLVGKAMNAARGDVADNGVKEAFTHLHPEAAPTAKPTPNPNDGAPLPRKPTYQQAQPQGEPQTATATIGEQMQSKAAENAERLKTRAAANDARKTEAAARTAKNRAAHGQWRAAAGSLSGDTDLFKKALEEVAPGAKYEDLTTAQQSKIMTRAQEMKDGK